MNNNRNLIIILIAIIAILIIALTGAIVYIVIQKDNNASKKNVVNTNPINSHDYDENEVENNIINDVENDIENGIEGNSDNIINNSIQSPTNETENTVSDMEKLTFNTQFTSYLGRITGTKLNNLLQTIQASNSANAEHQISLTSNNLDNLNGILPTDFYIITLVYDTQGYINCININKEI